MLLFVYSREEVCIHPPRGRCRLSSQCAFFGAKCLQGLLRLLLASGSMSLGITATKQGWCHSLCSMNSLPGRLSLGAWWLQESHRASQAQAPLCKQPWL